jgi:hypothetical protein
MRFFYQPALNSSVGARPQSRVSTIPTQVSDPQTADITSELTDKYALKSAPGEIRTPDHLVRSSKGRKNWKILLLQVVDS